MNGDREGETAGNIKEDMTASPKPRFFKMKKCVIVPNRPRGGKRVQVWVCVRVGAFMCECVRTYSHPG